MCEVNYIKANEIFPEIIYLLKQNLRIRMTVTGMSMYPFLRENIDSVELVYINYDTIKRGDIVLILRDNGEYVLHRVIYKRKDEFFLMGDAQQWKEGPIRSNQLIALVTTVWRKNINIRTTNIMWRLFGFLWLWLRPLRYKIIRFYVWFRRRISGRRIKCKKTGK